MQTLSLGDLDRIANAIVRLSPPLMARLSRQEFNIK